MSKIRFHHTYNNIISLENLLKAWKEFVRGKRARKDVQEFERDLMISIIALHHELDAKTYSHSAYQHFKIADPKPRHIHKATVRDRILHRAIYRILYPFFQKTFIADSFSCQLGKGTHKAISRFRDFGYQVSRNNTKTCWILKCDIRKFFDNIDHRILREILAKYITDEKILWLLSQVIDSFYKGSPSTSSGTKEFYLLSQSKQYNNIVGLPLGNLTSQLFVNIYMNEFDQFVKHKIKAKYYIRYADDFVIFSENKEWLEAILPQMAEFLKNKLGLEIHPNKVFLKTLSSGVDFLGWVNFPDHRVLRTATKRRMLKKLEIASSEDLLAMTGEAVIQSYLELLKHGNTKKIQSFFNH